MARGREGAAGGIGAPIGADYWAPRRPPTLRVQCTKANAASAERRRAGFLRRRIPWQILTIFRFAGAGLPRRRATASTPAPSVRRCTFRIPRLSVRARIIVLGVIPVIGFLAYGIAFWPATSRSAAPSTACNAHRGRDASRDLKAGLLTMRRDDRNSSLTLRRQGKNSTTARGSPCDRSIASRRRWLLAAGPDHAAAHHRARSQSELRQPGRRAEERSASPKRRHDRTTDRGQRRDREYHPGRSVVGRRRRRAKLLMSLLTMRRYEIEYRLTARAARQHFLHEIKTSTTCSSWSTAPRR